MKTRARILYKRGAQQKVWIEVYFDPELDGRWHITQWTFHGLFDPMESRHKTLDESYEGIREARDAASALRHQWLKKRDAANYRRYMPQDVKVTVTPKCDDLATAVLRGQDGTETPDRTPQGMAPPVTMSATPEARQGAEPFKRRED